MSLRSRTIVLASLAAFVATAQAQIQRPVFSAPPSTRATVGDFAAAIAKRAAALVATPAQWNHNDTGSCPPAAKTFSIACAIQRAVEEGAGLFRDESGRRSHVNLTPAPPINCQFHAVAQGREGTCGLLFDELPIFTISRARAITSGTWRPDMQPVEVWSGFMSDAESPVEAEARQLVAVMTTKKYQSRLVDYNNDSSTTFADITKFFQLLQDRVRTRGSADLATEGDSLEIEIYAGGTGVIRTYNGWFPISGFLSSGSEMSFQVDTSAQVPPNAMDVEILRRADRILSSDAVWNRADNRQCPPTATTWSIYCAVEIAEVQVSGGFHHRRPVMELVRTIVDERTAKKTYPHRLMGYNNDPSTTLADVHTLFAEAIARIK